MDGFENLENLSDAYLELCTYIKGRYSEIERAPFHNINISHSDIHRFPNLRNHPS
jgi:hypothetical protein